MKRLRERLSDERGFTLPEMMVTIFMMVVVLFALYGIFDASIRVFAFGNDRLEATQNARLGLERMEREIRAAYPPADDDTLLAVREDNSISFQNMQDGESLVAITYALYTSEDDTYTLRRAENAEEASPIVEKVRADDPSTPEDETGLRFDYLASDGITQTEEPEIVRISLTVVAGEGDQTLTTDVNLRNSG